MKQAILKLVSQLHGQLKTLTVDHGKELVDYRAVKVLTKAKVYFVHAYSSYERGSNENRN